jgi:hypothetical protein
MAKLTKAMQKEVESADSGFTPLPDGVYHAVLKDVDPTRSGAKGPYWSWEYEIIEDLELEVETEGGGKKTVRTKGRKQWNNTSLSQQWSLKQTFDAFGVSVDTDTDELIGKPVRLVLSQRTIQDGPRKGEVTNQIDRVRPADPESEAVKELTASAQARKDVDDLF